MTMYMHQRTPTSTTPLPHHYHTSITPQPHIHHTSTTPCQTSSSQSCETHSPSPPVLLFPATPSTLQASRDSLAVQSQCAWWCHLPVLHDAHLQNHLWGVGFGVWVCLCGVGVRYVCMGNEHGGTSMGAQQTPIMVAVILANYCNHQQLPHTCTTTITYHKRPHP